MNYIFFDTNIVYGSFFLDSKELKSLLQLAKGNDYQVCMFEFVYNEILKKYNDAIRETVKKVRSAQNDFNKYQISGVDFNAIKKSNIIKQYSVRFNELLALNNIKIISYPQKNCYVKNIAHRYFAHKKPFDANKLSFQDAIIWYSLVDFLEGIDIDDDQIHFISNNTKDFAETGNSDVFHGDLLEELPEESRDIIHFYKDIDSFILANGDFDGLHNEKEEERLSIIGSKVVEILEGVSNLEKADKISEILVESDIIKNYIESDLMNSAISGEYDVGWGEDVYLDFSSVSIKHVDVDWEDRFDGYISFYINIDGDYSIVYKNPMYEKDYDDEEFIYESANEEFELQITMGFYIQIDVLDDYTLEDIEDIANRGIMEYIIFKDDVDIELV